MNPIESLFIALTLIVMIMGFHKHGGHINHLWLRTDKFNDRLKLEQAERAKLRKRLTQVEHQLRQLKANRATLGPVTR